MSSTPGSARLVFVSASNPKPFAGIRTFGLTTCTSDERCGSTCHGILTVSRESFSVMKPSNSTLCSSGPLPAFAPPKKVQTGSFVASIRITTSNVVLPNAGTVTLPGVMILTAPLAASLS